ncbi:protease inhibitor I42 family protein [Chitinasiproducens palmae]|uniref:Predicted secreted protein n=1 Tax=Chitinasiproducens palmae TaxID=1770053 RepID=A0A1H2PJX1_9BURK|nr:protease inhibitor I42 family protein [Chitinasiproducens palmae]SDV46631.1 Predicted secreted protein [Chitinasiproducens palmae]
MPSRLSSRKTRSRVERRPGPSRSQLARGIVAGCLAGLLPAFAWAQPATPTQENFAPQPSPAPGAAIAATPPPATVTPEPDGSCAPLDLSVGQVIVLALPGNAGTGYRWVLVDPKPLLEPDGEPVEVAPAQAAAIGGARLTQWRLRAAQPGEGALRAEYRRPWEQGAAPGAVDDVKRVECRFTVR